MSNWRILSNERSSGLAAESFMSTRQERPGAWKCSASDEI
jgi:hypothetical protein